MTHLDFALPQLKEQLLEMMKLVKQQVEKSHDALTGYDKDLAYEIIYNEKRINAFELKVDIDCENILALFSPVAIDLRFVMASYNINSTLERIGDNAKGIAHLIIDMEQDLDKKHKVDLRLNEMFKAVLEIMDTISIAFEKEDTKLARKIFKQDLILNEIHKDSANIIAELIKTNPNSAKELLYIFTIIKKLERIGDLAKNIAEELIFYIEAKVLKHSKKKIYKIVKSNNSEK